MDVIRPIISLKRIRYRLVFFCFMMLWYGCEQLEGPTDVSITYEKGRAVEVSFKSDIGPEKLKLFVKGASETAVLGIISRNDSGYRFQPAIPLAGGQSYEFRSDGKKLSGFTINDNGSRIPPEMVAIYPTNDTVPENLLKIYLQFSQPMQAVGKALDFITVMDNTTGHEINIFLELKAELWNAERNQLTLWLDPGRIKTDLIPNQELGLPLRQGHEYEINISAKWRSAHGETLNRPIKKMLYVKEQDSERPTINTWKIASPAANTPAPLLIRFGEAMDAILAVETITITDSKGTEIEGDLEVRNRETELLFTPLIHWNKGKYYVTVDSKLEDLAGNNLDRLFDTDLSKNPKKEIAVTTYKLFFTVH